MLLFIDVAGFIIANNGGECGVRILFTFTNVTRGRIEFRVVVFCVVIVCSPA
jgi:hypothetical protein